MTELLLSYGLFLAQTVTVVLAIGALVMLVFGLARRDKGADGLEVTHLNHKLGQMRDTLRKSTLPKKAWKKHAKEEKARKKREAKGEEAPRRRRVFVIDFHGDVRASGIWSLREEVTAILTHATREDEVVVRLENAGGMVHGHGLAASQLARIRAREIALTVAVDKVAASGGYMMACVASTVLAAPFAVIGSIGVLAQIPNFNRLLDAHGIDFEQIKAGEFKRTLTLFGKNTEEDRKKLQEEVETTHALFKQFVAENRKGLDIDAVSTGEHWYGRRALELGLVDRLTTSDDYLLESSREADIYEVRYKGRTSLLAKLSATFNAAAAGREAREEFPGRL